MCEEIRDTDTRLMPGWVCCKCRVYNGPQRATCKACDSLPCANINRKKLALECEKIMGRKIFDPKDFK